jgi:DNA polymerase-3 subunit alpha
MLAYKTAYLKAHYPVAFMAAMLNSELSSSDTIAKYIAECRNNMGIRVLPPDINQSAYAMTVEGDAIRFGLGAVKGVGEGAIESVLEARRRVGRFRGLAHLACEIDLRTANRKVLESLAKAGAFDGLGACRAALVDSLDGVLEFAQRLRRERENGQSNLFGVPGAGGSAPEPAPDPRIQEWPERERLSAEKETLGFYLTGNPLLEHQEALERLTTHSTAGLKEGAEGQVTVGGMVTGINRVKIKSGPNAGRFMGRFVLEDLEGSLPVTLFANQLQQFGHLLVDETVVLVKGQLRDRGSDVEITVEEIVPLGRLAAKTLAGVDLVVPPELPTRDMLELRDLLTLHPGPVPVSLVVRLPEHLVRIATRESFRIDPSPELSAAIEALLGPGSVHERPDKAA